jgi:hypothetical protein
VTDRLEVTIDAAGIVDHYGSPVVTESISGVGKLTRRGDK